MLRLVAAALNSPTARASVYVGVITWASARLLGLAKDRQRWIAELDVRIEERTTRLRELRGVLGEAMGAEAAPPAAYPGPVDLDPLGLHHAQAAMDAAAEAGEREGGDDQPFNGFTPAGTAMAGVNVAMFPEPADDAR